MNFGIQNRNYAFPRNPGTTSVKLSSEVSVVKRNGQTTVYAGKGSDTVSLQRFADGTANVSVNDESTELSQEEADNLIIDTEDGNDNVEVSGKGARGQTLTLKCGSGNDVIYGDRGGDVISGGSGNDVIYGGGGDDIISGGSGNDVIYGGGGDDIISGGSGNDVIYGGGGDDIISGGSGNDVIYGDKGNDLFKAGSGNDVICSDKGKELFNGVSGKDVPSGDKGKDLVSGGPGPTTPDSGSSEKSGQDSDDAGLYESVKSAFSKRLVQGGKSVEQIAGNLSPGSNLEAIERVGYSYDIEPEDLLKNKKLKKLVEELRSNKLISKTPVSYGVKKLLMAAVPDNLINQSALKIRVTRQYSGGYDMEVYSLEKNGVGWDASLLGDKILGKRSIDANLVQLYGQGRSINYSGVKDLYHFDSPAEVDKALNYFRNSAEVMNILPLPYDKDGLRLPTVPRPDIEIGSQKSYASPQDKQYREFLGSHKTGQETVADGKEFRGDAHASIGFGNALGYEGRAIGYWHSGVRSEGDIQTEYETGGWKLADRVRSRISPLKMPMDSTYSTWKISHISKSTADGSKHHDKSELVFSNSGLDTDVEIDSDKVNKQQIKISIDPNKILQKPGENPLVSEPAIVSWAKDVFSGGSNNSPDLITPEQKSQYVKSMLNEMLHTKVAGDAAGKANIVPWLPGTLAVKSAASLLLDTYGSKELDAELDSVIHGQVPIDSAMDLPVTREFLNTVFGESAVSIDVTQNEVKGDAGNIWQSEPFKRNMPFVKNIWTMQMSTLSSQQILDSKTINLSK